MSQRLKPFHLVHPSLEGLNNQHQSRTKVIYLSCIGFVLISLFASPFIYVNVGIKANGILRSNTSNNPVISPVSGMINRIWVKENQLVQKSDTIVSLSTESIQQQIDLNQVRQKELKDFLLDLRVLLKYTDGQQLKLISSRYQQQFLGYYQEREELAFKYRFAQQHFERQSSLLASGTIAKTEWEQAKYEQELYQQKIQLLQQVKKNQWQQEKGQYQQELAQLSLTTSQLEEDFKQHFLLAPINGHITQLQGLQAGNYLSSGHQIATISANDSLVAEAMVSPSDIGLLQTGMPVRIKIDAFQYNQWGMASGTLKSISQDIIIQQQQPFFKVRCELDQDRLSLANGYQGKFKKGMSLGLYFQLNRRSLFQLLYDKMEQWLVPQN